MVDAGQSTALKANTVGGPATRLHEERPRHFCRKCSEPISGQFVRALGATFHIACFSCRTCGCNVASKFFPVDDPDLPGEQYALCETHYFGRLDLLCHKCGAALRGSYITALERKYHIEHFTCSICPTVFGPQDSYYEHDGEVYCHYHFSLRYAQKCCGCQNSILKQFVDITRNGQNQHWHPECYMIQKFWNVKIALREAHARVSSPPDLHDAAAAQPGDISDTLNAKDLRRQEDVTEAKVSRIWNVLSSFEESSASCISDMLLNVSNGAYIDGVLAAVKFIAHVEVLFAALDQLEIAIAQTTSNKPIFYGREARMLCKKIISFFSLLSKTQEVGVRKLGVTQELLSLVTALAHYLKLLIRVSLNASLRLEREDLRTSVLEEYLDKLGGLDLDPNKHPLPPIDSPVRHGRHTPGSLSPEDHCAACSKLIEDACMRYGNHRMHMHCLSCRSCRRDLSRGPEQARFDRATSSVICSSCANSGPNQSSLALERVSQLSQYVFLLRMALRRLHDNLRRGTTSLQPQTDPDQELRKRHPAMREPGSGRAGSETLHHSSDTSMDYASTLNSIRRARSTNLPETAEPAQRPRRSRILNGPDADTAPEQLGKRGVTAEPLIVEDETSPVCLDQGRDDSLKQAGQRSITFDDLNKFVVVEQSKQRRPLSLWRRTRSKSSLRDKDPNHAQLASVPEDAANVHANASSTSHIGVSHHGNDSDTLLTSRTRTYFSELSNAQLFIIRHLAVISLEPLVRDEFSMEYLLELIETRKGGFWNKFNKAFAKPAREDKSRPSPGTNGAISKKKAVFGTSLEILCERAGADSTQGVGPQAVKVPAFLDDILLAMRGMDMSVEGIFRKNGNIRKLKVLTDTIDRNGGQVNLTEENPVQLAALLKRFLRDLPEPIMTHKLFRLFLAAQRAKDDDTKCRIIHLTCCLLPQSHRNTLEILLVFLNWAAQFAQLDEEGGSKMDEHNLATVIAPNVLYARGREMGMEDSFAAIETMFSLIRFCEDFCCVPDDLMSMVNDAKLFSNPGELTTKDILKRCEEHLGSALMVRFRNDGRHLAPSWMNANEIHAAVASKETAASGIDKDG
ncbi:Rho-type GTPase activating protein Rga1 [Savitreella phatthalungensis]